MSGMDHHFDEFVIAVAFSDITEKNFLKKNFRDSRQSVSECIAFRQTLKRSL